MNEKEVIFNVFKVIKNPSLEESCFSIQAVDSLASDKFKNPGESLGACLVNDAMVEDVEMAEYTCWMDSFEHNQKK